MGRFWASHWVSVFACPLVWEGPRPMHGNMPIWTCPSTGITSGMIRKVTTDFLDLTTWTTALERPANLNFWNGGQFDTNMTTSATPDGLISGLNSIRNSRSTRQSGLPASIGSARTVSP